MLGRLRGGASGARRRLGVLGTGFVETFLRENRVIPPVLALLALLVFAWIVAGIFVGGPDDERETSRRAVIGQAEDAPDSEPLAPEVENPNVESYAAYQSKDPFRQLLPPAGETTAATTPETTTEDTTGEATTGQGGGGGGGIDTDGDGLSDQREAELGLDPFAPDTDADGELDGDEGAGGGGRDDDAGRDGAGRDGGLFDSGGDLRLP